MSDLIRNKNDESETIREAIPGLTPDLKTRIEAQSLVLKGLASGLESTRVVPEVENHIKKAFEPELIKFAELLQELKSNAALYERRARATNKISMEFTASLLQLRESLEAGTEQTTAEILIEIMSTMKDRSVVDVKSVWWPSSDQDQEMGDK